MEAAEPRTKVGHFGPPDGPLFGAFELPSKLAEPPCGVVVCAPAGQEALRSHRALRQLALRLTAKGLAALRFDYFGCGDSAGECEQGEVGRWLDDVETALTELQARARATHMALVGLRLGASLAALAGARRGGDLERLVLWEPVIEGSAYVGELLALHRAWLRSRADMAGRDDEIVDDGAEVLGFPLTEALRRSVESINLFALAVRPAARVLIMQREQTADAERFRLRLAELGAQAVCRQVPEPAIWLARRRDQSVVPPRTLETIVDWIGEAAL